MFSTPAIRPFSQENTGSLMAKKVEGNNASIRKPFSDRTVNAKTPEVQQKIKSKIQLTTEHNEKIQLTEMEEDDSMFCDVSSYKEVADNFKDICPKAERMTNRQILDIVKAYCNYGDGKITPPPSEIDDEFELPSFYELPCDSFPESIPEVFEDSCEDISLPTFDDIDM